MLTCEQAAAAYASRWQLETCFDELETSPLATGEQPLTRRLLGKLSPGGLLLADRNFLSYDLLGLAGVAPSGPGGQEQSPSESSGRLPFGSRAPRRQSGLVPSSASGPPRFGFSLH